MRGGALFAVVVAVAEGAAGASLGGRRRVEPSGARFRAALAPAALPGDEVVATVDGRAIYASAVRTQAAARGVDVRRALDDLVTAEVLAGEAVRRGLAGDRDADEAAA